MYVNAAAAGVDPGRFWELTLYEINVAIRGYHARERMSIVGRIVAIGRAFKKDGNPLDGLLDDDKPAKRLTGGMAAYTFWGRTLDEK